MMYLNIGSLTGASQSRYAWDQSWFTPYGCLCLTDLEINSHAPSGFSVISLHPTNIGTRWVDYQDYFGHRFGVSPYEDGSRYGLIMVRDWGNSSLSGLLWNTADAITETVNGDKGPFCASGIISWRNWTENFVSGILSTVSTQTGIYAGGLSRPHIAICGLTQRNNLEVIDWWSNMQLDNRYRNEIVAVLNGTGFTVSGLYSRYISEGGSPPNLSVAIDDSLNQSFARWWFEVAELIRDYAVNEAFYKPIISGLGINLYGCVDTRLPARSGNFFHDLNTSGIEFTNRYNHVPFGTVNAFTMQNSLSHGPHGTPGANWLWTNSNNFYAVCSGSNKSNMVVFPGRTGIIDGNNITLTDAWMATGMNFLANLNVTQCIAVDSIAFFASGANILFGSTGMTLPTGIGGGGGGGFD
jgi:hypothetical protein